ncbi:MAG: zinc dependent phospholipase C family protein [Syntrophobacteraceae bacterium]
MPAGYAHFMISNEAIKAIRGQANIDPGLLNLFDSHLHFIHIGSVAPDYPYLDLGLLDSKQKLWADHMHYEFTGDMLMSMASKLLEAKKTYGIDYDEFVLPFSWASGYLSHVTADLAVHPFIYANVGSYKGHEDNHRELEMIQDAFIYKKITGEEIRESKFISGARLCSDPDDDEKIHPILAKFWGPLLDDLFPHEYEIIPPVIDHWHKYYLKSMNFAGDPPFLGRAISNLINPEAPYTYNPTDKMSDADKALYYKEHRLPDGKFGTYEIDVFPKAVSMVAEKWTLLCKGLSSGDLGPFEKAVVNCDMDTGLKTAEFAYW